MIIAILKSLKVHHTAAFAREMCISNIQPGNLLGIVRLLEVFGVRSAAVSLDDGNDFRELDLPFLCQRKDKSFVLVTSSDNDTVTYTGGKTAETSDWAQFIGNTELMAVMLSVADNASEPDYSSHRRKEVYEKSLWLLPAAWFIWLLVMQFTGAGSVNVIPTVAFRISAIGLSALGLFLCVLLHRQWTGDSNVVERVCSLFKTSACSSAHDTFFFNKWFDLSEVGASYFLAIILIVAVMPQKSYSVAWMILPALPASLWNIGYQFIKQKHWCPLCLSVQILFWIIAFVFLLCGAYADKKTFVPCDIINALLLWGSVLVAILKSVTPSVVYRHKAETALSAQSSVKGNSEVIKAILGEPMRGMRNIVIAVSPTCPFCKNALDKIEGVLLPTGRFNVDKKYKPIHKGDEEKIEAIIGKEEAELHRKWCDEHDVKATPTVFVNGKELNRIYSVDDLLYL